MNNENLDLDLDLGEEPAASAAKPEPKPNTLQNPTVEPEQPKKAKKPINKKKLRTILLSTLIPVAAIGGGVGTFFAVKSCKSTNNGSVELNEEVSKLGVKVKSYDIQKGKDSTIVLTLPDNKALSDISITIGNAEIDPTKIEFVGNTITIKADAVTETAVIIKSVALVDIVISKELSTASETECLATINPEAKKGAYGKITIPEKFEIESKTKTVIGISGCDDCAIEEVTFAKAENITTIEDKCFMGCTKLIKFTVPANVKEIGSNTFANCSALTEITIGDKVEIIGANAFSDTALTEVTLPKTITKVEAQAFENCEKLTSVTFADTTKKWVQTGTTTPELVITDTGKNATYLKICDEGKENNWGKTGIEVKTEVVTKKAFFEKVAEWVDNGFVKSTNEYNKDVIQISNLSGEGLAIKKLEYDISSDRKATAILADDTEVTIGDPYWTYKESAFKEETVSGVTYTITDEYVSYCDNNPSTAKDQLKEIKINKYGYVEKEVYAEEKSLNNEFVDAGYFITYPGAPDVQAKIVSFGSQTEFELADYCDVNSGGIQEVNENDKLLLMQIKQKDGTTHEGAAVNVSLQTENSTEIATIETTVPTGTEWVDLDFVLTAEQFKKLDSSEIYKLVITAKI